MKVFQEFSLVLTLIVFLMISCDNGNSSNDGIVLIKFENKTGYDLQDVQAYFFFGSASPKIEFVSLDNDQSSEYIEIPRDSLSEDGFYYTYVNAFSESLNFHITIGSISPNFEPERAELLIEGKYTFLLEFIPAEYLTQSLTIEEQSKNEKVLIRIRNKSNQDFKQVLAYFPENNTVDFGSVQAEQYSRYDTLNLAFRYSGIKVVTATDSLKLLPIDYVGEEYLKNGKYSYDLDIQIGPKDVSRIIKD